MHDPDDPDDDDPDDGADGDLDCPASGWQRRPGVVPALTEYE